MTISFPALLRGDSPQGGKPASCQTSSISRGQIVRMIPRSTAGSRSTRRHDSFHTANLGFTDGGGSCHSWSRRLPGVCASRRKNSRNGWLNPSLNSELLTTPPEYEDQAMPDRGIGKIYKRAGSRFWQVELWVRGKRYTESAKSTRKADATALLEKRIEQCRLVPGLMPRCTVGELLDDYLLDLEFRG